MMSRELFVHGVSAAGEPSKRGERLEACPESL
jgi:hypothetical protein